MNRFGTAGDPSLRSVAESAIIDYFLALGFPFEVRQDRLRQATQAAQTCLNRLIDLGLPFRQKDHGQCFFDPIEAINFMKWTGIHEGDPFWSDHYIPTARRHVLMQDSDWATGGAPPGAQDLPVRRFSLKVTRRFNLASFEPGQPVRLRMPLPLEKGALSKLQLGIVSVPEIPGKISLIPGRLEARLEVPASQKVSLSYWAEFESRGSLGDGAISDIRPALTADEASLYTQPMEGFIHVSPRVIDLAQQLAGHHATKRDAVLTIWDFVMDHLFFGMIHYHEINMAAPMDWLLDHVWSDCQLGSALMASLCRALKIPARICGGHKLYQLVPDQHFWLEVWLEDTGWTSFDIASWDIAAGGRDAGWRNYFRGAMDYRVTTECFPRTFAGAMSLRLPAQWHMMTALSENGLRNIFGDSTTGKKIYEDEIMVHPLGLPRDEIPGNVSSLKQIPSHQGDGL